MNLYQYSKQVNFSMPLISCTQSFITASHVPITSIEDNSINQSNKWHANLFKIGRNKNLLFTHASTLFSVVITNVVAKDFARINDLFFSRLHEVLKDEILPVKFIEQVIGDKDFYWVKNGIESRPVLGSMNDMVFMLKCHMGSKNETDVQLSRHMNVTPFSLIGYERASDRFRQMGLRLV